MLCCIFYARSAFIFIRSAAIHLLIMTWVLLQVVNVSIEVVKCIIDIDAIAIIAVIDVLVAAHVPLPVDYRVVSCKQLCAVEYNRTSQARALYREDRL